VNRAFPYCSVCGAKLGGRPPITCRGCGTAHWVNAKPCAGVLVTDSDGRLLLLRRANEPWLGRWDIPGGFCEFDEHPIETAVREAAAQDVVLIAGKGHESYQEIAGRRLPFSDQAVAREAVKGRGA